MATQSVLHRAVVTFTAARPVTAAELQKELRRGLKSSEAEGVNLIDAILSDSIAVESCGRPKAPRQAQPSPHGQEYFVKISGAAGGYVDREGFATLDKSAAYRWQSRSAAEIYIVDNLVRLGSMTLEEAPKR